jgi:hypothetical protein
MMYRSSLALVLAGALSACATGGGKTPYVSSTSGSDVTSAASHLMGPNTQAGRIGFLAEPASAQAVDFDPVTGALSLPDLEDTPARSALFARTAMGGAELARDHTSASQPSVQYYAVFRRTDSSAAQTRVGDQKHYLRVTPEGVLASQPVSKTRVPQNAGTYQFTGDYAAVRSVDLPGRRSAQYVLSTVVQDVSFAMPQSGLPVGGAIVQQQFFDQQGVVLRNRDGANYVAMRDNPDLWARIERSAQPQAAQNWAALMTAPDGHQAAGLVVVTNMSGTVGIDADGTVELIDRDTGAVPVMMAQR